MAAGERPLTLEILLELDDEASKKVEEFDATLSSLDNRMDKVRRAAERVNGQLKLLDKELTELAHKHVDIPISADTAPAKRQLAELVATIDNTEATIKVGLESGFAKILMETMDQGLYLWAQRGAPGMPNTGPLSPASIIEAIAVAVGKETTASQTGEAGKSGMSAVLAAEAGRAPALGSVLSAVDAVSGRVASPRQIAAEDWLSFGPQKTAKGSDSGLAAVLRAVEAVQPSSPMQDALLRIARAQVFGGVDTGQYWGIRPSVYDTKTTDILPASSGGGGGGIFSSGLLGAVFGGGDKGGGGFLSALGWGGGGGMFGMPGMAAFGSVLGLMGMSFEHVLTTGLGLVGSLIGAIAGGLVAAFGAASTAAVGFLTDMAGIGQAANDIKAVTQAKSQLQQAITVYGPNSIQAQAARGQVRYALSSFSPRARGAVNYASNLALQFRSMFDTYTGLAEKHGAQIIASAIKMADKFLPVIGRFAKENTIIIQKALGPLFKWMGSKSGGLGIFTSIEQIFHDRLPAAMKAFDEAVKLLIKTMGFLAPLTGHFLKAVERVLARLSTKAGWDRWTQGLKSLLHMFHVWFEFFKLVAEDTYRLVFKYAAGLFVGRPGQGGGVIQLLTGYLQRLHTVLGPTYGPGSQTRYSPLSNLFNLHKSELMLLVKAAVQFGKAMTLAYLQVAPAFLQFAVLLLKGLNWLLHFQGFAQLLASLILFKQMSSGILAITNGIGIAFRRLGSIFGRLGGFWKKLFGGGAKVAPLDANTGALDANTEAVTRLTDAMMTGGGAGGVAGAATSGETGVVAGEAAGGAGLLGKAASIAIPAGLAALAYVLFNNWVKKHFHLPHHHPLSHNPAIRSFEERHHKEMTTAWNKFKNVPSPAHDVTHPGGFLHWLETAFTPPNMRSGSSSASSTRSLHLSFGRLYQQYLRSVTPMEAASHKLPEKMISNIIDGLVHGTPRTVGAIERFLSQVSNPLDSSSTALGTKAGRGLVSALEVALQSSNPKIHQDALRILDSLKVNGYPLGTAIVQGLVSGINSQIVSAQAAGTHIAAGIALAVRKAAQIHSPSRVMQRIGQQMGDGLVLGLHDSKAGAHKAAADLIGVAHRPLHGGSGSGGAAMGSLRTEMRANTEALVNNTKAVNSLTAALHSSHSSSNHKAAAHHTAKAVKHAAHKLNARKT